ncbi:MAG TPA: FAD-dependent oxidoreductase [Rhizomicrobium sp.]|jgi:glycine/D-amino acid oxidase-like deaminating enzyme|nr:FAD-dependent oxidoreductase [Rhizomicrobium sp.]
MSGVLDRRRLIQGSAGLAILGLGGCATTKAPPPSLVAPPLAPIRASVNRLFDITVCLRPFRAQGPRLDTEQVNGKLVVHNYGHGGSGWSLSWGSATVAVRKAMQASPKEIAVVGCGALGLTSAIVAQGAGAQVTIYARDMLPDTRSARATGSWTPTSRIALESAVAPEFPALWEEMARISFKTYRRYLGLPGNPVEWTDRYYLADAAPPEHAATPVVPAPLAFADYTSRIRDIQPMAEDLPPGSTPFPVSNVRRTSLMQFNIADYGHTLMSDFLAAGGKFVRAEFASLGDVSRLKEKVVINCPGYGARALCKDESVVPVRGQIGWLLPQPEVNYGLYYDGVSVLSRRDGIVVQILEGGDMRGYNDTNETADRAESEDAVRTIARLYEKFGVAPPT